MPLISCPDCGASVSDRAAACVHCGAPLNSRGGLLTVFFYQKSERFVLDEDTALRLCTDRGEEVARFAETSIVTIPVPRDVKVHTESCFPFPDTKGKPISLCADRHTYVVLRVQDYAGNLVAYTECLGEKALP